MSPRATQIKTYSWGNAQVALVGNKVDLEEDRQVPTEDAQRLATELGQDTHTHTLKKKCLAGAHVPHVIRNSLSALSRLSVLRGQCQRQHQREGGF